MSDNLDKFGRFVVENVRDVAVDSYLMIRSGRAAAQNLQALQNEFASLRPETRRLVDSIVARVLEVQLHDLLFALQDSYDRNLGVAVLVDGVDVAKESGMLHGELYGEGNWIARYSRYPDFPRFSQ